MSDETEEKESQEAIKHAEVLEKFLAEERSNQSENDIITIDLATSHKIPQQLHQLITCKKNTCSKFDVLNLLVVYAMYEVGFIGDWIAIDGGELSRLSLNWCYSFDRRIFEYCTPPPPPSSAQQNDDSQLKLIFKFTLDPERVVALSSLLSGDIALLTVYELENLDESQVALNSRSLALPISRYLPFKRLCENIPSSFRHMRELSIKLKDELLLPIRNEIYCDYENSTPSLLGLPECIVIKIFKYLTKRDAHNLHKTCRKLNDVYKASVNNNKKRKFE